MSAGLYEAKKSSKYTYLGKEFSLVNVQVGTTDTASLDLDLIRGQITSQQCSRMSILEAAEEDHYQDIVLTQSGNGNVDDGERLRLLISEEEDTRLAALKGRWERENNFEAACWDVARMMDIKKILAEFPDAPSQRKQRGGNNVGERRLQSGRLRERKFPRLATTGGKLQRPSSHSGGNEQTSTAQLHT